MSELGYLFNHWVTVIWLSAAALYAYFAVIADLVKMVRGSKKEQDNGKPET